jgi:hypothetical protein
VVAARARSLTVQIPYLVPAARTAPSPGFDSPGAALKRLLTAVSLIIIAQTALVGGVAAQESPTSTPTDTPTGGTTAEVVVDDAVRVVSYSYSGGQMRIVVDADVPKTLTVTQAPDGSGARQISIREVALTVGRTVVTIPAKRVTLTTAESVDAGRGAFLSVSSGGANPVAALTSFQSLLTGAGVALGWVAVAGWRELRKEQTAPEVAR